MRARDCPVVAAAQSRIPCADAPTGCAHCPFRDAPDGVDVEWVQAGPDGMVGVVRARDAPAAAALLGRLRALGEDTVLVWGLPGPHPERPVWLGGPVAAQVPPDALDAIVH